MKNILILMIGFFVFIGSSTSKNQSTNKDKDGYITSGLYLINKDTTGIKRVLHKDNETFFIHTQGFVDLKHYKKVKVRNTKYAGASLDVQLDEEGSIKLSILSKKCYNTNAYLGLVLDNKLVASAYVGSVIKEGMFMYSGGFTKAELNLLRQRIKEEIKKTE